MAQPKASETGAQPPLCQHHWVIDTPNGTFSGGRCKRCGTMRDFRNSAEDLLWDADSFSLNGSRYRGRRAAKRGGLAESA